VVVWLVAPSSPAKKEALRVMPVLGRGMAGAGLVGAF
jgi:hypothetical protein